MLREKYLIFDEGPDRLRIANELSWQMCSGRGMHFLNTPNSSYYIIIVITLVFFLFFMIIIIIKIILLLK